MRLLSPMWITSILLLAALTVNGQQRKLTDKEINNSGVIRLTFYSAECAKAPSLAELDIAKQIPFLVLKSGFAPQYFASDTIFEANYGVFYREEGCVGPVEQCMVLYNQRVFEYLTATYGNRWMKTIRKDVVGFKQWRKKRN